MSRTSVVRPVLSAWLLGLAALIVNGAVPMTAKAESPANWRVVSGEIRNSLRVPDGRTFTYGYADIVNVRDGRPGVLFSLYKPGVPVTRFAIPADRLSELNPIRTKGWFDLPGWLKDLIDRARRVVDSIQGMVQALKDFYKAVLELFDALGLDTANRIVSSLGGNNAAKTAMTTYVGAVNDAAHALPLSASFAERMAFSHWATIQRLPSSQRSTVWYAFALSIIDKEGY